MAVKVAIVTGASRGIGQAIAKKLSQSGWFVVGTATSQHGVDAIVAALSDNGIAFVLDVGSSASVDAFFDQLKYHDLQATALINNAGITDDALLLRMSEDQFSNVINTNLTSVYRMTSRVIRNMVKARAGKIVTISSVVAALGNAGQVNYCAAKGAIESLTKALAREVASRGITVNAIAPGFIATDMTNTLGDDARASLRQQIPLGKLGSPQDIAEAVAFIVSDAAGYITGQTIHVNGGMYMQ